MLGNYLLLTFRHLERRQLFTFVTIVSLAIGMAVALLILNYVSFEQSYDTMHPDGDRLYRVESRFYEGNVLTDDWATSSYGYGPAMQQAIPGIERVVRFDINNTEQIVRYDDRRYRENGITSVDPTLFEVFGFRLREGDPEHALEGPNKVVITPYAAAKYFPAGEDPIGKTLRFNSLNGELHCEVTGVLDELPRNTHIQFDFFISWETLPRWLDDYWYRHEVYTYVRLAPGVDPRQVEAAFPALAESHKTEEALRNKTWRVVLNPVEEVHLTPQKQYEREAKGSRNAVETLILVAWAILAIAWINYINLATARSLDRAREVGIRKVSGGTRGQLIGQFILESAVVNLIALALACCLVSLCSPWFDRLIGQPIGFVMLHRPLFWIVASGVFVLGVLLSGFYPAFVISNARPVQVLKGRYVHSGRAGTVRKCLVVIQFTAALVLIAGTFTVDRQLAYMRRQPLGMEIRHLFAIRYPGSTEGLHTKMEAYKKELQNLRGVESVSLSGAVPGMEVATFLSNRLTGDPDRQNRLYEMLVTDGDYHSTYGMQVVAGRGFGEEFTGDEDRMVVNEAAVRALGFTAPEEALGQRVTVETREDRPMEIVGVVADYHQQGLGNAYTPIMANRESAIDWLPRRFVSVRFSPDAPIDELLHEAERRWKRFFVDSPFDSFFVDRFYDRQYRAESRFGTVFALFAALALSIAVVGLWVLTLFAANHRRKELGIRKVFGATGLELFHSLSSEFLWLVAAAVAIGVPLAWFVMTDWLRHYPFRIGMSWWLLAVPAAAIAAIALATVSGRVWMTLRANPLNALKNE
ncbi:MAG: ABC transporter permease [Rikenella sp.]|nr:ABC transporter permease [Rikenella sp.]